MSEREGNIKIRNKVVYCGLKLQKSFGNSLPFSSRHEPLPQDERAAKPNPNRLVLEHVASPLAGLPSDSHEWPILIALLRSLLSPKPKMVYSPVPHYWQTERRHGFVNWWMRKYFHHHLTCRRVHGIVLLETQYDVTLSLLNFHFSMVKCRQIC